MSLQVRSITPVTLYKYDLLSFSNIPCFGFLSMLYDLHRPFSPTLTDNDRKIETKKNTGLMKQILQSETESMDDINVPGKKVFSILIALLLDHVTGL